MPDHGGLVCKEITPEFVPSPTFTWQANLYDSGFCSVHKPCRDSWYASDVGALLCPWLHAHVFIHNDWALQLTLFSFLFSVEFLSERRLLPSTTCTFSAVRPKNTGSSEHGRAGEPKRQLCTYLHNAGATLAVATAGPHLSPRCV